jgi:hypothetical protein
MSFWDLHDLQEGNGIDARRALQPQQRRAPAKASNREEIIYARPGTQCKPVNARR